MGEQEINDKVINTEAIQELKFSVLAQAIRDCASVNRTTQIKAIGFFISDDFRKLCEGLDLDTYTMRESMMSILSTPRAMLKKVTEDTISSLRASLWQKKANS